MAYPQFGMYQGYRPRPVSMPGGGGMPNNMSPQTLRQIVQMILKEQESQGAGAKATESIWDLFGKGGTGAVIGNQLAGTGGTELAGSALTQGGFSAPSLLAPEIAAVDVAGSGATAAAPAAGLSTLSYALPLAAVALGPTWAPTVNKAGQKFAKLAGISNPKPNRKYKREETAQSKVFNRQIPGFDKLSEEQKLKISDAAHESGALRMPGEADEAGNTKSGIGMDLVRPRFMSNPDYWENLKNTKGIGSSQYHLQTTPIEDLAKEGRDEKFNKFVKVVSDIKNGAPSEPKPVTRPTSDNPLSFLGGGPDMINNAAMYSGVVPKRKDSPGFKDGKRINYGRR